MELYKKHRPKALRAMVGCGETVAALENMLKRGTLPHSLLFTGPSGCGKTTLARILRRELGCHDIDFHEVNSGSFRGIDTVREVMQIMNLAPAGGPCRVWLFDECHKWTNDAMNASLKMLEDTPRHVYFFLATTDPDKLLKAVRTRCTDMPVRALTYKELGSLVDRVAKREKVTLSGPVRDELVASAMGSARTALVLLEKVSCLDEGQREKAIEAQVAEQTEAIDLCRLLIKRAPWPKVAAVLKDLTADEETVRYSVLGYARKVLLGKPDHQAYLVVRAFAEPFYNSKAAGLAAACFEVVFGEAGQ